MTNCEPTTMPNDNDGSQLVAHNFLETTYFDFVYCDFCKKLLNGMTKQGIRCQECGMNVHRECAKSVPLYCEPNSLDSQINEPAPVTVNNGSAEKEQINRNLRNLKKREHLKRVTNRQWKSNEWFWKGHMLYSNNIQRQMFTHFWVLDGKSIHIYDRYQMINKVLEIPLINIINAKMRNDGENEIQLHDGKIQKFTFILIKNDNTTFYCGLDTTDMGKVARDFYNIFRIVYMPYQSGHRKSIKINAPQYKNIDFHEEYLINPNELLGSGSFGNVYGGVCKESGKSVAIKLIDRIKFDNTEETPFIQNEVLILCNFKHPGIVQLYALYDFKDHLCIVTEQLATDMLQMILSRKPEFLSERVTKFITYQILVALNHLHSRDIAHCDLKPENILLTENIEFPQVKICDFGYAKIIGNNSFRRTMVGTPQYAAPEVRHRQGFNKSNDIWALGVIIYVSLTGVFPFVDRDSISEEIKYSDCLFPSEYWSHISNDVIDLVKNEMWQLDIHRRSLVSRILKHIWFSEDYQLYLDLQALENKVKSGDDGTKPNGNWLITDEQIKKWESTDL